jgi:predicted phosphoribosyltransferase
MALHKDLWRAVISTTGGDFISVEQLYQAFKDRAAEEVEPIEPQPEQPIEDGAEIKALLQVKGDEP